MTINPLTYGNIQKDHRYPSPSPIRTSQLFGANTPGPGVANPTDALPDEPQEAHNAGEVMCSALLECRSRLMAKYGFVGNEIMMLLLVDAMKSLGADSDFQYANFLTLRDHIIQADISNFGGANRCDLWSAFAKRGMGFGASTTLAGCGPPSSCDPTQSTGTIVESFSLAPGACPPSNQVSRDIWESYE